MGKLVIGRAYRRFVKPGEILWGFKGIEPHPPLPVSESPADAPPPPAESAGMSNGGGASTAGEVVP